MRKVRRIITVVVFVLMFVYGNLGGNPLFNIMQNGAMVYAQNAATYSAKVLDEADLLTADQENLLLDEMQAITPYGNALFVSSNQVNGQTGEYARSRYLSTFGEQSGIIFLIDMTNREIYIYSHNEMFRIITRTNAYTITDNVYTYATDGDYYTCASMVYSQVEALLKGEEISRPMKHAGNLMLAVIFSILLNYWLLRKTSKVKELDMENLLRGSKSNFHMEEPKFLFVTQKRVRMSGGGGGGHGGGSSGGGGGGGGHSF